jgi:hypothetical protein
MREMFIGSQENLLCNVLGLPVIACQAGGGRKDHILIRTHEGRELGRVVWPGRWMAHWSVFV